jgi:hypothetical protein
MSSPSSSEQRQTSRRRITSPPEHTLAIRSREPDAFAQAGALVLGSGIPAFEEGSIYIPTGAENELTYTTVEAWWDATIAGTKDPKTIVYSIERVLRQILSCSDALIYGLCAILDKGLQTKTFQKAVGISDEKQLWNYLRDQSDTWRQALAKRDTYKNTTYIKIRTVKTILEILPDITIPDKQGRPTKAKATIVILLGDAFSPWNVAHLGRDTLAVFQKVVEAAKQKAGDRSFSTSYWVRFINRALFERVAEGRRGHILRKFRPIKRDVQRLLERIQEHGPWFTEQDSPRITSKEIEQWNKANQRVSSQSPMAMHPKFFVLCTQEEVQLYKEQTPTPPSPMHARVSSLNVLGDQSNLPSIAEVMSQTQADVTEPGQRAGSTITLTEGAAPDTRMIAHGAGPWRVIPVRPAPPNLPTSRGAIAGRDSLEYDDDDLDDFEVANEPEGDEDFADDISTNEFDGADDPDYDVIQHTRNARRTIAARNKRDQTCGCDTDRIEQRILNSIKRDKKLTPAQLMTLMRDFNQATRQSHSIGQYPVCKAHLIILAGKIGLKTAGLTTEELWYRVIRICQRPNELGDHKLASATMHWFTSASKALVPSDYLGIYCFPTRERKRMGGWTTEHRLKVADHYLKSENFQEWSDSGTINLDCFGWLWEHVPELASMRKDARNKCPSDILDYLHPITLADLFKLELDCYLWHQRRVNDKDNLGWLRDCWYSLAQDVVRQDPYYYLLYIMLREDNAYKLISYPYYCKYTRENDKTGFRHIDLNIPKLLSEQRGKYQIQGNLSLDDESETDCTIVVKGFHKDEVIRTWYNRRQDKISDGYVHNMRKVYNKQDEQEFGAFEPVPCKAGQVRITQPHLPHGALGPAQGARRTILPWYVRVQDDNSTLEIVEAGTWEELSVAHISKSLPPATPSGYGVMYGKPPYRFPGSGTFVSESPLSQALVGRRRWNDYELLDQVEKMMKSPDEVERVHKSFREEAHQKIPKLWQGFVEREIKEFGEYSFFRCTRKKLPRPEPWEGDEERIRHIIQQDKQVIEYAKKLETRRKGNYLTKAVEQDESEDSGVDDD